MGISSGFQTCAPARQARGKLAGGDDHVRRACPWRAPRVRHPCKKRSPAASSKNLGKSLCQGIDCDNRKCVRMEYPAENLARGAPQRAGAGDVWQSGCVNFFRGGGARQGNRQERWCGFSSLTRRVSYEELAPCESQICESSFALIHAVFHRNMLQSKDLTEIESTKEQRVNHESNHPRSGVAWLAARWSGESRMGVSSFAWIHADVSPQHVPIKGLKDVDSRKTDM